MTTAGQLASSLERAWDALRRSHPDLPHVQLTIAPAAYDDGGTTIYRTDEQPYGVAISSPQLALGGLPAFQTLAHHAAHVLAHHRGIIDITDGRYHNTNFANIGRELGLEVARDDGRGWSSVRVPRATQEAYADVIGELTVLLISYRAPTTRRSSRTERGRKDQARFVCGCDRSFRMAISKFELGPITCGACGQQFRPSD